MVLDVIAKSAKILESSPSLMRLRELEVWVSGAGPSLMPRRRSRFRR